MSKNYQEKFWRELDQLKIHTIYAGRYYEKTVRIDRWINMFLAVASSVSIGGWAIWKQYEFAWALIIATSQVFTAIKSYLPYSKRMKALSSLSGELESICLSMENHWFNIAEGILTIEEIHILHMNIKEQIRVSFRKNLGTIDIPTDESLLTEATVEARHYFENFYIFEEQHEPTE